MRRSSCRLARRRKRLCSLHWRVRVSLEESSSLEAINRPDKRYIYLADRADYATVAARRAGKLGGARILGAAWDDDGSPSIRRAILESCKARRSLSVYAGASMCGRLGAVGGGGGKTFPGRARAIDCARAAHSTSWTIARLAMCTPEEMRVSRVLSTPRCGLPLTNGYIANSIFPNFLNFALNYNY